MAKTKEYPDPIPVPPAPDQSLVHAPKASLDLSSMFARSVNGGDNVKSISFKRTLTRQLVSMGHQRELIATMTSEIYETVLPLAGRSDKPAPAKVIDCIDLETNQEIILVLNTMMLSALQRSQGGKTVTSIDPTTKENVDKYTYETPLIGRTFGFRAGDIKADKRYRVVDVVEVDVERGK